MGSGKKRTRSAGSRSHQYRMFWGQKSVPAWPLATKSSNISVEHLRVRKNIAEELFFDVDRDGALYADEASTPLARDWTARVHQERNAGRPRSRTHNADRLRVRGDSPHCRSSPL